MIKNLILINIVFLISLLFISCDNNNYIKYTPLIKIEKVGEIIFKEKQELNTQFHKEKIKLLLGYYYKDWKEGSKGEILIPKDDYQNKELIYNLTLKAEDSKFMEEVKKDKKKWTKIYRHLIISKKRDSRSVGVVKVI